MAQSCELPHVVVVQILASLMLRLDGWIVAFTCAEKGSPRSSGYVNRARRHEPVYRERLHVLRVGTPLRPCHFRYQVVGVRFVTWKESDAPCRNSETF